VGGESVNYPSNEYGTITLSSEMYAAIMDFIEASEDYLLSDPSVDPESGLEEHRDTYSALWKAYNTFNDKCTRFPKAHGDCYSCSKPIYGDGGAINGKIYCKDTSAGISCYEDAWIGEYSSWKSVHVRD